MRRFLMLVVVFVALLNVVFSSSAAIVGLDSVNGMLSSDSFASGSNFSQMRQALFSNGHTLYPLYDYSQSSLAGLDFVFVRQADEPGNEFSLMEIANLHSFVAGGGGMLAAAEAGGGTSLTVDNFNSLLSPYGVTVSSGVSDPQGHTVSGFVNHPLTAGVTEVGVDYQRRLVSISDPAIDLTIGDGSDDILAVVEGVGGAGNVIILSDTAMFSSKVSGDTNIDELDNLQLLLNWQMEGSSGISEAPDVCQARMAYGDFNCDAMVDLLDLSILGDYFRDSVNANTVPDANGDGIVNLLDLDVLGLNFNTATPVPEPGGLVLLGLSIVAMVGRVR